MKIQLSDHFSYQKLIKFVLPSVFMMIVTSIYGVVDGFFISNFVGKTSFASVNLIIPFTMILGGMGFMIGTGGTALVSKKLGENDREKANLYFSMLIIFEILLGVTLSIFGIILMKKIAMLLGATNEMINYCVTYGKIVVAFTTFYMLQTTFQSFLVVAEKPSYGLIITIVSACTNIVLDALFIVYFKWGLAGAAIATGIGQTIGGIIPLIYFLKNNNGMLKLKMAKLEFKPILQACYNGLSELLTNVSTSIVSILYNLQLMKFVGEDGVSAYGVLMYVQLIFLAIEIGYTIGSAPIIGYNYGAQNHRELKSIFKKSMILLSTASVALFVFAEILAIPLAKLFVGYDLNLYNLTIHAFRLFSFSFIFSGISIFSSGFFTALNNGLISAIISFLRSLIFQITFVFLLPALFDVDGIWLAMFATEVCAFIIALIFFIAFRKKYHYV